VEVLTLYSNASFDPGGELHAPADSSRPLLNLQIYPRMNIYLDDESSGSLIVDAALTRNVGKPYCSTSADGFISSDEAKFQFSVTRLDTGATVASNQLIPVNTTGNEIPLSLDSFPPRFQPYDIMIKTSSPHCDLTFEAKTQITRLPRPTDDGSVVKVDHLYGGLLTRVTSATTPTWTPIFPYSYYVDWGSYLAGSAENITKFSNLGYNIIHPTPGGGNIPFELDQFNSFLDMIEQNGMWLMYDMRWTFKNLTSVAEQVNRLKKRKSILLWYTGDEPDGQGDPLNSTVLAYNQIKSLDPYHPTSLVLNCFNFYYGQYAAGADIILADPYPVGQNATFSTLWNTPCNSTYGDCGCDGCHGNFRDVATRMDTLQQYQTWLNAGPKSFWGVPQAFGGSEYWSRPPTAKEEAVMAMLFINHNSKGIVAWNFPTTQELTDVTSSLAKTLSAKLPTSLLLGAKTTALEASGSSDVDAAGWRVGNQMLVSIVYIGPGNVSSEIVVKMPKGRGMTQLWPVSGDAGWAIDDAGLRKAGLANLEVSLYLIDLLS
jgi:hypothetical protein